MNTLLFVALPTLLCFMASPFYFVTEGSQSSVPRAILVSLYPLVMGTLSCYTMLQVHAARTGDLRETMFLICLILPPVLAAVTISLFKGPKLVHLFLLPVGYCFLQTIFVGLFVYLKGSP